MENKNISLSEKLRQKVNTQRMQRNNSSAKRSYLEKNKVPSELMDQCMNMMKNKGPNGATLQQLLQQVQSQVQSLSDGMTGSAQAATPAVASTATVSDVTVTQPEIKAEVVPQIISKMKAPNVIFE